MSSTREIGPTLGRPGAGPVEAAARQVFKWGLLFGDRGSAFTPGVPIWTSDHAGKGAGRAVRESA